MKTTYIIRELQNAQSNRKGRTFEAEGLSAAKRTATRTQMFQGTVLKIENERGDVLSIKENGKWVDS